MNIVREDVPLLLPIGLLRHLGSVLDLGAGTLFWKSHGTYSKLPQLGSGHIAIDICEFHTYENRVVELKLRRRYIGDTLEDILKIHVKIHLKIHKCR